MKRKVLKEAKAMKKRSTHHYPDRESSPQAERRLRL